MVLRDTGATRTIGGGVVIDPFPPRRGRRTPARLTQVQALEADGTADALRRLLATAPAWTDAAAFLRARNVRQAGHAALIAAVPAVAAGGLILSPAALDGLREAVVAALAAQHRGAPEDRRFAEPNGCACLLPLRPPIAGFAGVLEALLWMPAPSPRMDPWFRLPGHRSRCRRRMRGSGARRGRCWRSSGSVRRGCATSPLRCRPRRRRCRDAEAADADGPGGGDRARPFLPARDGGGDGRDRGRRRRRQTAC